MTDVTEAPKERKPRFSLEHPGDLATLESEWLKSEKGLDVTPAQVRGVLMFHGEFQKSDQRKAQVAKAREDRDAADALRKQEKADKKAAKAEEDRVKAEAKAAAKKAKAADDGVAAVADQIENDGAVAAVPEGPKTDSPATPAKAAPAKRPSRSKLSRPKSPTAKAAAEF